MNSTNETKMDMKQAKQNNTPNIRWTLVGYDLIVYALVAVDTPGVIWGNG